MKKLFTKKSLLLSLLIFSISFVNSQSLLIQDFSFSGNLTANGWTAVTAGAGTNPIATTTGLTYTGFQSSGVGNAALVNNLGGEDDNITFTNQTTDGQNIYYSFLANVTDAAATKSGDYFIHIGSGGGTGFSLFAARVFARITASGVNFGLSNTSTATYGTTNFSKNTTYLIIVKYTISVAGNDPVSMWVLPSGVPSSEATAGTPELTILTTAGQNSISAIALRQGSATNSVQTIVDGINVGLTWADVTPGSAATATITANGSISNLTTNFGSASTTQTFTLAAVNLSPATGNITITPSANVEISFNNSTFYTTGQPIGYTAGTIASTPVYFRIANTAAQGSFTGTVTCSGGTAPDATVNISGGIVQNYYNTKANLGLTNLGTWSTTTDGTGPSPSNFTNAYQYFNITNQTNANYTGVWDVSNAGANSKIIVGDGIAATTLTVLPGVDSITSASRIDVLNNANLVIQNNRRPFLNTLATGSTVDYAQTGLTSSDTIRVASLTYHNLKLTGGIKVLSSGTTTVKGNWTVDNVVNFNGAPSPFSTLSAWGDVTFQNGSTFESVATGDGNRLTLTMNGNAGLQSINGNGAEIMLFRLKRDTTTTDDDIILGANTNLTLGNGSGGGLQLTQGAATATTLFLSSTNTLKLTKAAVATATALGKLNTTNSNIIVEKSLGTTANAGTLRFAAGSTLNNVTVNFDPAFARDSITIADNVTINGALTLTKGKLVGPSGSTIDLSSSATVSGASTSSFVDGKLKRTGSTAFTFPVGKGNKYAPVDFSNYTGGNIYAVQYLNAGYGTYTINPTTLGTYPNYSVSGFEHWIIDQTTAGTVDLKFNYTDVNSNIITPSAIRMAHFGVSNWDDLGGTPDPGNTLAAGAVTVTGVSSFSPFTFASLNSGVIPVKLTDFIAQKLNNTVKLNWSTEQELNSKEFVVEKSIDGRNWNTLSIITAIGNSALKNHYGSVDNNPVNGINYYRLKIVDRDEHSVLSSVKTVLFSNKYQVIVAPNPATDFINILIAKNNSLPVSISISSINGKIIYQEKTSNASTQINTSLFAKGVYLVKIVDENNTEIRKIIIQ